MVCQVCEKLWITVRETSPGSWSGKEPSSLKMLQSKNTWSGSHHQDYDDFLGAVDQLCYICYTVNKDLDLQLLKQQQVTLFQMFYQFRHRENDIKKQDLQRQYELKFFVEISENRTSGTKIQVIECVGIFKIFPRNAVLTIEKPFGLTQSTSSDACKEQIREWLQKCTTDQSHRLCNEDWRSTKNTFPARLLNVSQIGYVNLEVVSSSGPCPRYATLSHCWETQMPVKLTTKEEEKLKQGLPIEALPRKFADAVIIAQWMKVKYLWIDALCIQQDSVRDWTLHSVDMGDIYTNSYCNIAATQSGPNLGCFTSRPVSLVEPYAVPDPRSAVNEATHIIGNDNLWHQNLLGSRLHNRGWVLQERLLSPRTVHFGADQIFWECRCQLACEAYPHGIPQQFQNYQTQAWRRTDDVLQAAQGASKVRQKGKMRVLQKVRAFLSRPIWPGRQPHHANAIWSKVVERYMECEITYGTDKLVAISGIAQKVAEITDQRYLAGLWNGPSFAQSLLWYVLARRKADQTPSVRSSSAGQAGYRAPSWSWASLDAKLIWNWPSGCKQTLINIIKVNVDVHKDSPMGMVSAATMKVKGCLVRGRLSIANQDRNGAPDEDGQYTLEIWNDNMRNSRLQPSIQKPSTVWPVVYLDTPLLPSLHAVETHLLPICTEWEGRSGPGAMSLAGLLLGKSASTGFENAYERIGMFGCNKDQAYALCGVSSESCNSTEEAIAGLKKSLVLLV